MVKCLWSMVNVADGDMLIVIVIVIVLVVVVAAAVASGLPAP